MSPASLAAALPLPVVIPLAGAVLAPLAALASGRLPLVVSILSLAATAVPLLAMAPTVYGGHVLTGYLGHWGPVGGAVLGDTMAADPWGLTFALVAALIGAVTLLFMLSEQGDLGSRELGWFACLFLLLDAALIGGALTGDLMNMFVWFEVAALASYGLTGFFLERPPALEASFKILVLTTIAGFLIFTATALIYQRHGALNLGQIHDAIAGHPSVLDLIALGLLLAGFATKAGLVPFHGWLPDAHTIAPGPVSALFSGLMVNFGIVAIGRLVFSVYTPSGSHVLGLLMALGLASALAGAGFALLQEDLKRLLAYDTISQMGLLAVGLATATAKGLAGTEYHLANHALFKTLLFLCAGTIVHATGATELDDMAGIARRMPLLAAAFVVGAAAIAGIPPLNGYASVGLIHDALLERHEYLPFVITLAAQIVTIAALGKVVLALFRPRRGEYPRSERLRPGMVIALSVLGGACLAFGVLPALLLGHVMAPAAAALGDPAGYAHALLSGGGPLRRVAVGFDYFRPTELITVAATVALAVPLVRWAGARRDRAVFVRLRAVQTGSVNDYASYLVIGLLATVAALAIGHSR